MSDLVDIVVPQVGEGVSEVVLVRWLVDVGDSVEVGRVLFEVDTEKAVVEVEAFDYGTIEEILIHDGEVVTPTQVVGRLRVSADT